MKKLVLLPLILFCLTLNAQTLTQTNLPIIRLKTNGATIPNEPKMDAEMQVIWQPTSATNNVNDTAYHYNGRIGIELRGTTSLSSGWPKKSYSIELRNAVGADSAFALLGMPKESDWAFTGFFYDNSMIRDALVYHLGGKIMAYAPRFRFVELILDGNYQGIYLVTEKIKRDKNRVNVSKLDPSVKTGDALTGGYILKIDHLTGATSSNPVSFLSRISNLSTGSNFTRYQYHYPKPDSMNAEQRTYISDFMYNFEDIMNSPNYADPINGYRKYINDTSFVDFFLMNEMSRNVDAYRLSTYFYKDKNSVDPRLKMGPLWDFNFSLGSLNFCQANRTNGWAFKFNTYDMCGTDPFLVPFWWQKLFDEPRFRTLIKSRWRTYRAGEFTNTKITSLIDSLSIDLLGQAQVRNFQRWNLLGQTPGGPITNGTYMGEVDFVKRWLEARLIWLDGQIEQLTTPTEGVQKDDNRLTVLPNPASQDVVFNCFLSQKEDIHLDIFNTMGQIVEQKHLRQSVGEQELIWQTQSQANGMYLYRIYCGSRFWKEGKVVVAH
jgi:hypothetical protein